MPYTCHFCNATVADALAAGDADWIPYYYRGKKAFDHPVCPRCARDRLVVAADGEMEERARE
jgi:hypothetical protein